MDPPKLPFRPYITKSERKNCVNPKLLPLDNQLKSNQINETYIQQLFLSQEIILQQNVKKYYSKPFRRIKISEHISSSPVWTTQWCPKYSHLLAATCDNYIHLYDIFTTQKRVYSIQENKMTKYCCWSNTSRQLMSACVDGSISVYDFLHSGVLSTRLKLSTIPSCCLWWKDNNDVVLIGGNNSFLEAYDLRSNERVAKYEVKGAGDVLSMDLFPDACNIVVSYNEVNRQSSSHNLIIWDIRHAAKISDQIFHVSLNLLFYKHLSFSHQFCYLGKILMSLCPCASKRKKLHRANHWKLRS